MSSWRSQRGNHVKTSKHTIFSNQSWKKYYTKEHKSNSSCLYEQDFWSFGNITHKLESIATLTGKLWLVYKLMKVNHTMNSLSNDCISLSTNQFSEARYFLVKLPRFQDKIKTWHRFIHLARKLHMF